MDRLQTPWGRFVAHLEAYFVDHEILRKLYRNFYPVAEGVFRSNHPSPGFIKKLQRCYGLKTIVSLRSVNKSGPYLLEKEACDELGVRLFNQPISSRKLPKVAKVLALKQLFEQCEKPILIHCKSGADRAGLASVLYRHFVLEEPIGVAVKHLHWRYGHFRYADTGRLDFFFDTFLAFEKKNPGISFSDWLENHYSREELNKEFKPSGLANILVNTILRRE